MDLKIIMILVMLPIRFSSYASEDDKIPGKQGKNKNMEEAKTFMEFVSTFSLPLVQDIANSGWNYESNLTDYNRMKMIEANGKYGLFAMASWENATKFAWKEFKKSNTTLYRWFRMFVNKLMFGSKSRSQGEKSMSEIFGSAKIIPYKSNSKKPTWALDPELTNVMRHSRDPRELMYVWKKFRDATGRKIRRQFIEHAEDVNVIVQQRGYKDLGDLFMAQYEWPNLLEDLARVMEDIMPLYMQIHAYVRKKLKQRYKNVRIKRDGPIPVHILGQMYGQSWAEIYDILDPFPGKKFPNVTDAMQKKRMKPLDMFVMAEKFFVSIGMKRMTPYFWHYSVIEKPTDRDILCHASAHDFFNNKDYRVKMCTQVTSADLDVVHHEMGHIQYYMHYRNLNVEFQDAPNPGFHEAIGDAITLSSSTPSYQRKICLLKENDVVDDPDADIAYLMRMGLKVLPNAPYTFIVDMYRYSVYNGSVKNSNFNRKWWELRLKYQGVCPSIRRTERDFDAGAKYHVAFILEYMRYFIANTVKFQFYEALCNAAGHEGPLFKCNIYKSKEAGKLLSNMMKMGSSKSWQEAIRILTGGKSSTIEAKPMLKYFDPLYQWLKSWNKNEYIGWKSEDPMKCP